MGGISALGVLGTGAVAALTLAIGAGTAAHPDRPPAERSSASPPQRKPRRRPIRVTIDPGICGQTVPDESVVVDASGHLSNVVVTVPGVKAQQPAEASFTNEKCRLRSARRVHAAERRREDDEQGRDAAHDARRRRGRTRVLQHQHSGAEHDAVAAGRQGRGRDVVLQHAHVDARRTCTCPTSSAPSAARTAASARGRSGWNVHVEGVARDAQDDAPVKVTVKDGETVTVDLAFGEVGFSSRSIRSRSASGNLRSRISSRVTQRISWPSTAVGSP